MSTRLNALALFVLLNILVFVGRSVAYQDVNLASPCRSVHGTEIAGLAGSWTVEWSYRLSPGQFANSVAQSTIGLDLTDCAVVERFEGVLDGHSFSAMTIITWQKEDRLDRVRIDSEHGSASLSSGHAFPDSLVFRSERDLGERVLRTRHVFFEITNESFVTEFYMSRSSESPWELVQRAEYRRRGVGD